MNKQEYLHKFFVAILLVSIPMVFGYLISRLKEGAIIFSLPPFVIIPIIGAILFVWGIFKLFSISRKRLVYLGHSGWWSVLVFVFIPYIVPPGVFALLLAGFLLIKKDSVITDPQKGLI